ncbi:uncharacterized protein FOMMEDRAFT_150198 [Fomitiporia mediterranea MF3/22]|uniref:uncharacterized protein n=1 Tax=Fomitiporia mediterranea (strain MF3/22) TaxID=694068 RepID=UPI000440814C|nr:uncharacterized protein FOMMEDRAFT_150198 [Fomitiporia mediterranea MF3/22]EJD07657.1 hypothetical protein FOMMEDRAFT_150198 [Fomitiporia mediterranea MF3/22]
MFLKASLFAWALQASVLRVRAANCTILFDGRIPPSVVPADFDTSSSVYDDQFVRGQNQTWAEIIKFPDINASLFDADVGAKALEVTLSDDSIFVPGGSTPQLGFRRSELLPAINSGTDGAGHDDRPLVCSFRYHQAVERVTRIVFHETNDFSIDQFMLKTGTLFGETFNESEAKTLRLQGSQTVNPETFFTTPFDDDVWHNFAVTVGWTSNDFTVYYSRDLDPLSVVNTTTNDNSGQGQQQFGILKLPTGDSGIDVVHEGFQESGINEGLIYGGIFIENSSDGCVSLS